MDEWHALCQIDPARKGMPAKVKVLESTETEKRDRRGREAFDANREARGEMAHFQ